MAPEIINRNEQDDKVDIWSLGILMYELVHGKTPFVADDPSQILEKTMKGAIAMSKGLSEEVKDFIKSCLRHHAKNRKSGKELLNHPLFVKHRLIGEGLKMGMDTMKFEKKDERDTSAEKVYGDLLPKRRFNKRKSQSLNEIEANAIMEKYNQESQQQQHTITVVKPLQVQQVSHE